MRALKKINNNVAICVDSTGRELIAMGKGLGFGEFPREVPLDLIERTFYDVDVRYRDVVRDLPAGVLEFSAGIVDIARNELPYDLTPNLVVTLADHIAFAIERAKKQLNIRMPLAYDVEQLYPAEYRIGKYAVRGIQKQYHIGLPNSEAAGIAMSLLNGKLTPEDEQEQAEVARDEEMLDDITGIVEKQFRIIVDRDTFNYSRYATHLQYLFQRIHAQAALNSDNLHIYKSLREEFPEIAGCVEKIGTHIQEKWNSELTEEEKLYLILHINRICVKEGL